MNEMLDKDTLGAIATEAAAAMFSLQLEPTTESDADAMNRPGRHTVVLRLHGVPAIFLSLGCDREAGAEIAHTIFEVSVDQTDDAMIDDALRELANIFAGQVKSMLAPDHEIGLPRVQHDAVALTAHDWHGVSMRIGASEQCLDLAVAA